MSNFTKSSKPISSFCGLRGLLSEVGMGSFMTNFWVCASTVSSSIFSNSRCGSAMAWPATNKSWRWVSSHCLLSKLSICCNSRLVKGREGSQSTDRLAVSCRAEVQNGFHPALVFFDHFPGLGVGQIFIARPRQVHHVRQRIPKPKLFDGLRHPLGNLLHLFHQFADLLPATLRLRAPRPQSTSE